MVATRKYLLPDGKMMTEAQLDRQSMKKIFDLLIQLNVADKGLYHEYQNIHRPSRPRSRSRRTRSRTRSRTHSVYLYPRTRNVYWRSASPPRYRSRSPVRTVYRPPLIRRTSPRRITGPALSIAANRLKNTPYPLPRPALPPRVGRSPVRAGRNIPKVSCHLWRGEAMCNNSGCTWNKSSNTCS